MEKYGFELSWYLIAAVVALYTACVVVYRLTLHPLAGFPGPKLAAVTLLYEGYYDCVRAGRYTFKIAELHMKYGPIIRISPHELHIMDPFFHEKLYRHDGRWHRYPWTYDAIPRPYSMLCITNHDEHKVHRHPLGSFFSKAKIRKHQGLIRHHVDKLCHRIQKFAESKAPFDVGAALSAFARDVSLEYTVDERYSNLDEPEFNKGLSTILAKSGWILRWTKQVRLLYPAVMMLPAGLLARYASGAVQSYYRYEQQNQEVTKRLVESFHASAKDAGATPNMVHVIMASSLPASHKTLTSLIDEVAVVGTAAFETTASVLRLITFHIFTDAGILNRLRDEIADAALNAPDSLDWEALERLPYLTAVITEGLRLSPGVATRLARISDKEMAYNGWMIPAGTPVSMTTLLMHMNEDIYPEPSRFNPERWTDPAARRAADKTFAPFSKGTRICIGMHLAWAELYLLLAALVARFDFRFPDATAADFECVRDDFIVGTRCGAVLKAVASVREQ